MNYRIKSLPGVACVAAIGVLFNATAFGAVGARVLVQEWTPVNPERQDVRVLVDQPGIVTDSLNRAWASARVELCNAVTAELGKSRAAAGQTLRDIDCHMDPNLTLDLRQVGPNSITATLALNDNSITATSTQPTACGRECDPRVSVTAKATVTLGISVQNDPARPLVVTAANLVFSGASIDSHNFVADIAKFVVDDLIPFFNGPNFKTMAQDAINGVKFDYAGTFNSALAPVNAQLAGPSQYVRVGLWARATRITVAFAPGQIPPPGNGSMSGVVHWDETHGGPPNGCADINLVANVQTGPAPLLDPDNYRDVGVAPMRTIGAYSSSAAGAAQCNYSLTGIAAGWPNTVSATVPGGGGGGGPVTMRFAIKPDGWSGAVVPQPASGGRNYLVYEKFGGAATNANPTRWMRNPGDPDFRQNKNPRTNPADIRTQPGDPAINPAGAVAVQPGVVQTAPAVAAQQPATLPPPSASPLAQRPASAMSTAAVVQPVATPAPAPTPLKPVQATVPQSALHR